MDGLIDILIDWLTERLKGDLQTICRFSYNMRVYKLITLGTKFKNL